MIFNIAIFLLVIGVLVFFHEMGHFLAAKACGIYCPRFSLGMPPRLFGIKIGETDYCVGALPIGGYVKMAGQEDAPLTEEEREKEFGHVPPEQWFSNKPVWQRMIVIAAGPAMNVVLAILIYAIVNGFGAEVPSWKTENRIGKILPESPAASAPLYRVDDWQDSPDMTGDPDATGLQTGDRIVAIDGNPVRDLNDIMTASVLSGGDPLTVHVERTAADGGITPYIARITPSTMEGFEAPIIGVDAFRAAEIKQVTPGGPADVAGLQEGDVIERLSGEMVDQSTLIGTLESETYDQPVSLQFTRNGELKTVDIVPARRGKFVDIAFENSLVWLGAIDQQEPLEVVYENTGELQTLGFQAGDIIESLGDEPGTAPVLQDRLDAGPETRVAVTIARTQGPFGGGAESVTLDNLRVADVVQAVTPFDIYARPIIAGVTPEVEKQTNLQRMDEIVAINGEPATVLLLDQVRERMRGQTIEFTVRKPAIAGGVMRQEATKTIALPVRDVGMINVALGDKMVFHRLPWNEVLPASIHECWLGVSQTAQILQKLITGQVSPKNLGGPVMIFQATTSSASMGYAWLMDITALISINLAIFNLLPLPVLDGGHLVFLTMEAIRRKPVNQRVMEWVQQAGVILIIVLLLFVTYNDVKRWVVNSVMP